MQAETYRTDQHVQANQIECAQNEIENRKTEGSGLRCSAQALLNLNSPVHCLDKVYDVYDQQNLHLSIAILEELLNRDVRPILEVLR